MDSYKINFLEIIYSIQFFYEFILLGCRYSGKKVTQQDSEI